MFLLQQLIPTHLQSMFFLQNARNVTKTQTDIIRTPRYEDVLGSGGVAPRILNLAARWRRVVSYTPRPLYPQGKNTRYPLCRWLCRPQSRS